MAFIPVALACGLVLAQPIARTPAVRLKSRLLTPQPGVEDAVRASLRGRPKNGVAHVILQLTRVPDLAERERMLRESRVRLLDPIPEQAFFAAIPADAAALDRMMGARDGLVRWVGAIRPEDRVSPGLRKGAPPYARRPGGRVEMIVEFFGDVPVPQQRAVLSRYRAQILARVVELNGWRIELEEPRIMSLAGEDPVKWIEEVPAPPEVDNDGARSPTGVNADAVLAPNPYNLSGSGVVVGQWEPNHPSLTHPDLAGRITLGDALNTTDRSEAHGETVAANGQFDNGEAVYRDVDDSATVTPGDVRITAVGAFAAGSTVAPGNADLGGALVLFTFQERFADTVTADFLFTPGEGVYRDNDNSATVTTGDLRLTAVGAFAAGSIVAVGNADLGANLFSFLTQPHYHPTHVAGTVIGNGAQSLANGGAANQWKGVAAGATLRTYDAPVINAEYVNATANSVAISTNSWGTNHCHQVLLPNTCYDVGSQYYDTVVSGRQSDGTPSGLASRVAIFGSAGNQGYPERHADSVAANGQFDLGETVYRDNDDNGVVSIGDFRSTPAGALGVGTVAGAAADLGTALVNFTANERHDETVSNDGRLNNGEGIYSDADGSRTVTLGDTRLTAVGAFAAGSVVAGGNADVGVNLRPFRLWGTVRIPNSAKDTIEVANISSDALNRLSASSSRGPTDDGRVKPDLAGPGSQIGGDNGVTSTWPGGTYNVITGTSMSTPAVAGGAVLVTEWYKTACVAAGPSPQTVKALMVHAAQDITTVPNVAGAFGGPDFAYGYGRARVKEAADLLPHHRTGSAAALGNTDLTVTIGATAPLKVTLVWDDPAWTPNAAPSAATGILQNDLDLLLIAPNGDQYTPWVASGTNPSAVATRSIVPAAMPIPASARDRRNPIEQVVVDNAMPGTWTIRVTASTLNLPPQGYTLVSEALPPQSSPCTAAPAVDIWMKDNAADTGTTPSAGTMWLSPDVWNRYATDGLTAHQNPEYGQVNYIYANLRNAGAAVARASSLDLWLAPAAVGLTWPTDFSYVGRISVPNLAAASVQQIGPLPWNPPNPVPSDHFCFYGRLASPQDPITFAETPNVDTNARNSNNIVWRNINVVDLASSRNVTFLVRNVETKEADVDLELRVPDEFLRQGKVTLRLSRGLEAAWPEDRRKADGLVSLEKVYRVTVPPRPPEGGTAVDQRPKPTEPEEGDRVLPSPYQITASRVVLRGFRMGPRQAEPVTLTFASPDRAKASYEVHVVEHIRDQPVGGILYVVRTGYGKE